VAYVAYESYVLAAGIWVGLSYHAQPLVLGTSVIRLIVYIAVFVALLFRPASSAKAVFVFLTLFASLQFAAALYWPSHPMERSLSTTSKIQHFRSRLICAAVVIALYLYYRGVSRANRPKEPLQPTASRHATSLQDD
jgi:hypothetical protein